MLTKCVECDQEVSDSADVCPHCGYRLKGRDELVRCPHCNTDVIPEKNPHDTLSLFCPLCKKPVTNLVGRKIALVIVLVIFASIAVWFYWR